MFLTVDLDAKTPIYQQVADGIRHLIARGALPPGAALPSVRQLAGDLGVNLNTIAVAYRELQEEGLVAVRHGSGAEVIARRTRGAARDELRRLLRSTVTQLVVAGLEPDEIRKMFEAELKVVAPKGDKTP